MKLVTAIVRPFKLYQVVEALGRLGFPELTVTEVKGCGRQKGHTEIYRGAEYTVNFLPMAKIELAVPSHRLEKVIDAIVGAARTGHIGDGKVFVSRLDQAATIGAGEGDEATPPLAA